MKLKRLLVVSLLLVCLVMVAGCEDKVNFTSNGKSIYVDLALRQLKLTNVDFYDFMYLRTVTGLTGECGVVSNTLNGREIYIMYSPNQEYYVMCVDVTLSKMPSVFKLYKDSQKLTYDVYYK